MDEDTHFVGFLCNYEVYRYLREIKEGTSGGPDRFQQMKNNTHMPTLIYETLQYFQSTPCISQSPEAVQVFVERMKPYNLTKPEKLAMLNTRPTQPVEIQAIVEESEERLTETQIEEIIQLLKKLCLFRPIKSK